MKAVASQPNHRSRLLPFRAGGKWGYITADSRVACEPTFEVARDFKEGMAIVHDGRSHCVIDTEFRCLCRIPADVEVFDDFSRGLAVALGNDGHMFFLNDRGQSEIHGNFDFAFPFVNDVTFVEIGGRWGLVARDGTIIKPPTWKSVHPFQAGQDITSVQCEDSGKWALVDRLGNRITHREYDWLQSFADGVVPFGNETVDGMTLGVVGANGEVLIEAKYSKCDSRMSQHTLGVEVDDELWGVVDHRGDWIISPQYPYIGQFSDGYFLAYSGGERDLDGCLGGGKFGFVDRAGTAAFGFQFDNALAFDDGIAQVWWKSSTPTEYCDDMAMGYIAKDGRVVWRESV